MRYGALPLSGVRVHGVQPFRRVAAHRPIRLRVLHGETVPRHVPSAVLLRALDRLHGAGCSASVRATIDSRIAAQIDFELGLNYS